MGKIVWTEEKVQEMYSEGYGSGEGADYKPWVLVHHFNSKGRARRAWSPKTNRTHHLMSDGEAMAFWVAEWNQTVIDIREQHPLDRDLTQKIAEELGIRHPTYFNTRIPMVLTTDFLLTVRDGDKESLLAINVKVDAAAEDETTIEKLEIQRQFFAEFSIPHHLVFKSRMPAQEIRNIESIRRAHVKPNEPAEFVGHIPELETLMTQQLADWEGNAMPLSVYCSNFDAAQGAEKGIGLRIAQILMGKRVICAPLASTRLTNESLSLFINPALSSHQKVRV